MFRFLASLAKLAFFVGLLLLGYVTVSDQFLGTDYINQGLVYSSYLEYVGWVVIAYLVIFVLSLIERIFKKKKVVKSKGANGSVEVNIDTINDLTRVFLEGKPSIKSAKVKTYAYFSKIIINANVETYNIDKLNDRLSIIQNDLKEYINLMTGVTVREVALKIVKINQEKVYDDVKEVTMNEEVKPEVMEKVEIEPVMMGEENTVVEEKEQTLE